jgi:hypothetical protein
MQWSHSSTGLSEASTSALGAASAAGVIRISPDISSAAWLCATRAWQQE